MEPHEVEQVRAKWRRDTIKRVVLAILGILVVAGLLGYAVNQYYNEPPLP